MKMRLQKFIAECGIASRREAERLIAQGRVKLNGKTVREMGVQCDPEKDAVEVNGRPVRPLRSHLYVLFNKPRGVTSTRRDPHAETSLTDALPARYRSLKPVGRLDKWSDGLMLLTNHNELIHRMTHPSFHIAKEYYVEVNGASRATANRRLENGVMVGKTKTAPAKLDHIEHHGEYSSFHITIHEGRKRQIRIMCEEVGYKVRRLRRLRIGPVKLGDHPAGKCRELSHEEISSLLRAAKLDDDKSETDAGQTSRRRKP
ncbi:rRNA pseudouridine synthase [Candidatus Sumerlaeota bacterium]|nr:rRNA pseudouridine synthase [Candidatus Sumerlaeota bacterium]